MKSDLLKKIIAAGAISVMVFTLSNAQSAPNAQVNANGDLELLDDQGGVIQTIPKPAGEVVDGKLVIGGVEIAMPNGQVQPNGSLYLPDTDETLPVPNLPVPLFFTLYGDTTGPWLFNDIIKIFYNVGTVNPAANGWIWWEDWGVADPNKGIFYINTRTSEDNLWAYSTYHQSWVYFYVGTNGMHRLTMQPGDQHQGTVSYFVQSPAAGMNNWHIYSSTPDAAYSGQVKTDGSGIVWTQLR